MDSPSVAIKYSAMFAGTQPAAGEFGGMRHDSAELVGREVAGYWSFAAPGRTMARYASWAALPLDKRREARQVNSLFTPETSDGSEVATLIWQEDRDRWVSKRDILLTL
jgi:hypothetical protein